MDICRSFTEDVILCQQLEYNRRCKFEYDKITKLIKDPMDIKLLPILKVDFTKIEAIDDRGYSCSYSYEPPNIHHYHEDGRCHVYWCIGAPGMRGNDPMYVEPPGGALIPHHEGRKCYHESPSEFHIHKDGICYNIPKTTIENYLPFFEEYVKTFN